MKDAVYLRKPLQDAVAVEKIVTIYYFQYESTYKSHGESHDFWELNYVDRGSVVVHCDGAEYEMGEGEIILLPPNRFHGLRADGERPSNVFIISFEARSELLELAGGAPVRLPPELNEVLNDVVRQGRQAFALPMPCVRVQCLETRSDAPLGSQQMVRIRLEELLIGMLRLSVERQDGNVRIFTSKARFDDCIAAQIMELLKANVCAALTLADVAAAVGYGKTYVSNVFRKVYGTSIMNCHAALKIDEAKYLLREGKLTVTEISDRLGFSSPQYFARRFAQAVGMSPREFMRSVNGTWSTMEKRM